MLQGSRRGSRGSSHAERLMQSVSQGPLGMTTQGSIMGGLQPADATMRSGTGADVTAAVDATMPHCASMSHTVAAPVPEIDLNDPVALQGRVRELEEELRQKQAENDKLNARIDSMQAVHSGGTEKLEGRIERQKEEMAKKDDTIKKLEEEVKKLKKKADNAEGTIQEERRFSRDLSRTLSKVGGNDAAKALNKKIEELQEKLAEREEELEAAVAARDLAKQDAEHSRVAASKAGVALDRQRESSRQQLGGFGAQAAAVTQLQQSLAEREAEKQQLQLRLDRAQEAIINSAGQGFENEVKLQQARTALQCILKVHKEQSTGSTGRPVSPSPAPPKLIDDFPLRPSLASTAGHSTAAYRSVTDITPLLRPPMPVPPAVLTTTPTYVSAHHLSPARIAPTSLYAAYRPQ